MMRRAVWLLLAAVVPLLAACSPSSPSSSSSTSPSGASAGSPSGGASSASPGSSPPASPVPAGTATLVQFGRQGGLAGLSDTLAVTEAGHFTLVRLKPALRKTGQFTAAVPAELRRVRVHA